MATNSFSKGHLVTAFAARGLVVARVTQAADEKIVWNFRSERANA